MAEFDMVVRLQAQIWGSLEEAVPTHMLLTLHKEGGIVLLMFDGETPVGFAYGFLSRTGDGQLKLASHQAGMLPPYQSRGMGTRLKLAQRDAALEHGLELITWTFDPLQGRNARLNLHKLGAVCSTYIPNLYGDMSDTLNKGLPSDRFRVDWWLTSERVQAKIEGRWNSPEPAAVPLLNPPQIRADGWPIPPDPAPLPAGEPRWRVEFPTDLPQLKLAAPELALAWRLHTRQIFENAFATGYTATDLLRHEGRNFYLLELGS